MIDYKISNNKGFRYIVIIIDNFSKYLWARSMKSKYTKTITNEFSNILSTSKRFYQIRIRPWNKILK